MGRVSGGAATFLTAAVASLAGCQERAEAVQERADLRALVQQRIGPVERATGLVFKRPPAVEQRTRVQIKEYIVGKFAEELPPAELTNVAAAYRLFGLLPDTVDLRQVYIDLLTEQVAGYFEPDSGALYVATDLAAIDSFTLRTTISHELVHALQHQYTNLDSVLSVKYRNDRRLAAQAVLEGQATLTQTLVMMPEQTLRTLPSFWASRTAVRRQQAAMQQFASAPLWLREVLVFPYLGGSDFVRAFRIRHPDRHPFGKDMPVSTEQILHPERFFDGDQPTELAYRGTSAGGYEDGLGEIEIRVMFMVLLDDSAEAVAPRLASGWDGDRYLLLGAATDAPVLVWHSVWDSEADADDVARGLEDAWRRRWPARRADRRSDIRRLSIEGLPGVRLVDAPVEWGGWGTIPEIRIAP